MLASCPYSQAKVNDHPASSGVTCGQLVKSPAVVICLDRNYRYKSIATQIIHEHESYNTAWKFLPSGIYIIDKWDGQIDVIN